MRTAFLAVLVTLAFSRVPRPASRARTAISRAAPSIVARNEYRARTACENAGEPAASGSAARLTILAVPFVAIVPVAVVSSSIRFTRNDIAAIVRDAGFDPVIPPNRLRGPGALYVVDGDSL